MDRGLNDDFVPFDLHPYASLQQWIELQAATAGLDSRFDYDARREAEQNVLLVGMAGLQALPKRYFLAWMLHLYNLAGRVEDDTLVVTKNGESAEVFQCFKEPDGSWRKQVDAALQRPVTITATNCEVGQSLSFLSVKTDAPLLLDRPLMANERNFFPFPLDRKVDFAFTNVPLAEVIFSVFKPLGLTYQVQGGVIFIKMQEDKKPNQVPEDTARQLADPQH